jgi:alpha-tubulin suppressor-like RCC1 family protein
MKKHIIIVFLVIVCFCACTVQAVEQGEVWGWGVQKLLNGEMLTDITQIAAGYYHSLALKSDGSIVGWGYDEYGQATTPDGNDYTAIAAGWVHSLALKSDGSIVGWGSNYDAFGHYYGQSTPPTGTDFVAIAAGGYHSLALKADGSIVGWGWDKNGQATPPEGEEYVAIAAGRRHSLALKSDGSIVGWGWDYYGQETPPEGNDFVAIAAGMEHNLALKSDGSIVGWGSNYYDQSTPIAGNDFIAIAAGCGYSLALKSDGSIIGWGNNYNGAGEIYYGQATPPTGNDFVGIAAGESHSLGLKSDGTIVGWGSNSHGQAVPPVGNDFVAIAAGEYHGLALKSDGSIVGWGSNTYGQATPPEGGGYVAIAAGDLHSLALKSDGLIVGWGWDGYGQAIPPGGTDYVVIAAGYGHSLALKSDGSIVGWGYDYDGQASPPEGNDFIAIAAGRNHSLALKSDGSIVGWGADYSGQATPPVGNDYIAISAGLWYSLALKLDGSIIGWGSDTDGQATPPMGTDYVAIAAGSWHSLALKTDGLIVGWGDNEYGQATPPKETGFIAIAAGRYHNLAIRAVAEPVVVAVDIKPHSWPNPINLKSHGVLPVAVLGGDTFDVGNIDTTSIRLAGVEALRSRYEDIAALVIEPSAGEYNTDGPDGYFDLIVQFDTQAILEAIGEVSKGDVIELLLTGVQFDKTPIEGTDCVVIRIPSSKHEILIPDVVNLPQAEAEAIIIDAGLTVGTITDDYSDTIAAGNVTSQYPVSGELLLPGEAIDLVISLGVPMLEDMVWIYIDDPVSHGGFTGYMSKYETTNAQYCHFLNAALASGDIRVSNNHVYGANGSNVGEDFVDQRYFNTSNYTSYSQITWNGTSFSVRNRDGYDMGSHPVVEVSWYGATAFCNYYGFRLPREWEWQAVADFNGTYIYGCGKTIDYRKANYESYNPLDLSNMPYTSPVDYYPSYGYGVNDMAGNVWEWTSSLYDDSTHVIRGGSWYFNAIHCTVSFRSRSNPNYLLHYLGFRVCR